MFCFYCYIVFFYFNWFCFFCYLVIFLIIFCFYRWIYFLGGFNWNFFIWIFNEIFWSSRFILYDLFYVLVYWIWWCWNCCRINSGWSLKNIFCLISWFDLFWIIYRRNKVFCRLFFNNDVWFIGCLFSDVL